MNVKNFKVIYNIIKSKDKYGKSFVVCFVFVFCYCFIGVFVIYIVNLVDYGFVLL